MMINTSMRQIISHTLFSSVFAVFVVNLVQSTELDCMNQLESSKGRCFLTLRNQQQCCHVFASEACREELSTPDDDAPPFVGFIPNSLAFDRDRNQLCLHGLDMRTGEKTSSLYGFQIYARKWHKDWTKEEVTSLNYMLPKSPRFPSVVPKDPKLNPLKDIIICFDLGTEIKSTIPDVYVTVELVLLKPDKQATPVQHPDNPISLCTLDSLHLEKEGRCEVKRMELTPHTCEIKEETPILLKRVGEVPPSMPPTTIQVARNTTESFRGTTSSPNEEVTFWTEVLSWTRWVVALIVILGGALIVILSSALFAAIFCACVRRNRRIKNNDADAWRWTHGNSLHQSTHNNPSGNNGEKILRVEIHRSSIEEQNDPCSSSTEFWTRPAHLINRQSNSKLPLSRHQYENIPRGEIHGSSAEEQTQHEYHEYDPCGGRLNQTASERTEYSSIPGHHYARVDSTTSPEQYFITPGPVESNRAIAAALLLPRGDIGDFNTRAVELHVQETRGQKREGEKTEATPDASEPTTVEETQVEEYMEDPRQRFLGRETSV